MVAMNPRQLVLWTEPVLPPKAKEQIIHVRNYWRRAPGTGRTPKEKGLSNQAPSSTSLNRP